MWWVPSRLCAVEERTKRNFTPCALGVLATVASAAPQNLSIICLDNGQHGETGGQAGHTSRRTDLALMAEGAGIASAMTVSSPDELPDARGFLADGIAPKFLCVRVMPGPPTDYKRDWDLLAGRLRFRAANARGT